MLVGLALILAAPLGVGAQTSAVPQPDATVGAALENLASRASVVFAGQVVSIEHKDDVVEIVFHVLTPVAGNVGTTYTLREWGGLWPPGQWRYTPGERAMVFLHGVNAAGLSSAVDGGEGVVPLVADKDGTPLLDVRRLSTRVQRRVGDPLPDASEAAITLKDAVTLVTNWRTSAGREPGRRPLPAGPGVTPREKSPIAGQVRVPMTRESIERGEAEFVLQGGTNAAQ